MSFESQSATSYISDQ